MCTPEPLLAAESESISMIITIAATLLGTIIGSAVTYFFAVRLQRHQQTFGAGIALRAAFAEELYLLEYDHSQDAHTILKNAFKKTQSGCN